DGDRRLVQLAVERRERHALSRKRRHGPSYFRRRILSRQATAILLLKRHGPGTGEGTRAGRTGRIGTDLKSVSSSVPSVRSVFPRLVLSLPRFRLELAEHLEQVFVVGLVADVVDVFVGEVAVLVHDEERALGKSFRPVRAVEACDLALRLEVAQEVVGESAERLGPGGVAGDAVNGYAQDLGIVLPEAFEVGFVGRHLRRSDGRPRQRVKSYDDVLLAAEVRELHLLALLKMARQLEVRGRVSDFWHQRISSFEIELSAGELTPLGYNHEGMISRLGVH